MCQLKLLQLGRLPNVESKPDGVSFVGRKSSRNSLSYTFTDLALYQMLNYTNAKRSKTRSPPALEAHTRGARPTTKQIIPYTVVKAEFPRGELWKQKGNDLLRPSSLGSLYQGVTSELNLEG